MRGIPNGVDHSLEQLLHLLPEVPLFHGIQYLGNERLKILNAVLVAVGLYLLYTLDQLILEYIDQQPPFLNALRQCYVYTFVLVLACRVTVQERSHPLL